jgi:hypothetical protein
MSAGVKRELELAVACLAGSAVLVSAFVLSAGIHPPPYAIITVALLGAILVDGVRFYREYAVVTREDIRVAGVFRPARSILVEPRPLRRARRPAGPTLLGG